MLNKAEENITESHHILTPVDYPMEPVENMNEWSIHKLSLDKDAFMQEASEISANLILHNKRKESLSEAIAKVLYLERLRIINEPWKVDPPDELDFWNDVRKNLLNKSLDQSEKAVADNNQRLLKRITDRYVREIMSNFKIPVYKLAQRFLPVLFSTILRSTSLKKSTRILQKRLQIVGAVDQIRALVPKGTIVLVPTHFSNLDSILVGWAADQIGLSAFTYGAGINLYNKVLGYLFPRLGAYGLDRRKKNDFYLETLKVYSQLNIEKKVHSIFFPGGTRSRSGGLEDKLKMGLLGTAVDAQGNIFRKNEDNKIFIVPVVLNYHCVLEAKNLINSHLEKTGKELYLIEKKAFGGTFKLLKFLWKFFSSNSEVIVNFGRPMDVLGNFVDLEGNSLDARGNIVDLQQYYISDGSLSYDPQRNAQYTKMLSNRIVERYFKENIALSSHLVAFIAFNLYKKMYPSLDLFGILRLPKEDREIKKEIFLNNIDTLLIELRKLFDEGRLYLSEKLACGSSEEILRHGLKNLGIFHVQKALYLTKKGMISSENLNLLYYYHNRMKGYNLSTFIHEI